ncbi:MAG: OmpA family protein [Treponema sp.]|jgi:outer membrane protein OmpA-like peptidoglycan-associated protein|nr:OmpA family protein [Treponema sp.]
MTKKMKGIIVVLFLLLGFLSAPQRTAADVFEYKYFPDSRYRILSVVDEAVFLNGKLSHRAEILNRIAVETVDASDAGGRLKAVFQTSERIVYDSENGLRPESSGFQWSREYKSEFERDRLGYLTIDKQYYMPVVRNVPVFPDKNLEVLETWRAEGYEVHDFRDSFGIEEPYRIPFTANYKYLGEREWKGRSYPSFSVEYKIASRPQAVRGRIYPVRIMGDFDQIVYWDHKLGQAAAYEEKFSLTFEMSNGTTILFRGNANAEIVESEYMDKEEIAAEINDEIGRLDISDVNVRVVEEGIAISLEDIGFYPDSAKLLPGELEKIDRIAQILLQYSDRDIMIAGHTALAGTREGRMTLSVERAQAVADYLLSKKVRQADRMVIRGFGAEKPIADNNTQEGMRKNRRVEIILLEN